MRAETASAWRILLFFLEAPQLERSLTCGKPTGNKALTVEESRFRRVAPPPALRAAKSLNTGMSCC